MALTYAAASPETGAPSGPAWLSRGRVPCLDGLRALSILLVLLAHVAKTHGFSAPAPVLAVARHADIGVDVFFAISGFLITLLLVRELERTRAVCLRGFYRRRALRILPAYIVFLGVVFACVCLGWARIEGRDWLGVLTYTVNFFPKPSWEIGHVWSLSIEEQFYLFWPLTLWLLGPKRAGRAVVAYLALAPVLRIGVYFLLRDRIAMVDLWTPTRMDSIASGCLLALYAGSPRLSRWAEWSNNKAAAVALLLVGTLAASLALGAEVTLYEVAFGYSVNAACITALVWIGINRADSLAGRLLQTRPLVALGYLSYSLYLWQQLFLNPGNASWACRWPVNLGLALLTAAASYLLIEAPFLRLKERPARPETSPGGEPRAPSPVRGQLDPEGSLHGCR